MQIPESFIQTSYELKKNDLNYCICRKYFEITQNNFTFYSYCYSKKKDPKTENLNQKAKNEKYLRYSQRKYRKKNYHKNKAIF